jgi:hypothetical protein
MCCSVFEGVTAGVRPVTITPATGFDVNARLVPRSRSVAGLPEVVLAAFGTTGTSPLVTFPAEFALAHAECTEAPAFITSGGIFEMRRATHGLISLRIWFHTGARRLNQCGMPMPRACAR